MIFSESGGKKIGKQEEWRREAEHALMATHMALYYEEILDQCTKTRGGLTLQALAETVKKMGIENESDIRLFGGTAQSFVESLVKLGHLREQDGRIFLQRVFKKAAGKEAEAR